MKRKARQTLKSRLKNYQNTSLTNNTATVSTSDVPSVNDRIRKLRDEQARAAVKARAAAAEDELHVTLARRLRPRPHDLVPTLLEFCARTVALYPGNLPPRARARLASALPLIPVHLKQEVLSYCKFLNPITSRRLPLFVDARYEVLDLENTETSFEVLVRAWWKMEPGRVQRVAESWEELGNDDGLDDDSGGDANSDNDDLILPIDAVPIPSADDEELVPPEIVSILHPNTPSSLPLSLTTPLSTTLRALNLCFAPHLPTLPLAQLIALTLPRLLSLSLAGTLQSATGPRALLVLSRALVRLERWDLGCHPWLRARTLCGEYGLVNWKRDLGGLKWLGLEKCGNGEEVAGEVRQWLKSEEGGGRTGWRAVEVAGEGLIYDD
ncbi:hypothetical protein BC937DRAFT_94019 [Endogone sp. FLAS-F59071]|nr:hypothetical protein BC937DRAFT_94019 [Endogone sp. FLAS-F59071]|eukprot:RUS14313.1 hypothetical protein BC937DRAFT_94019 [Endogone sp. FLAS-F59071]